MQELEWKSFQYEAIRLQYFEKKGRMALLLRDGKNEVLAFVSKKEDSSLNNALQDLTPEEQAELLAAGLASGEVTVKKAKFLNEELGKTDTMYRMMLSGIRTFEL